MQGKLSIAQKKEWAKLLYLKENMTQKEIAGKVGTAEKTLSKWINSENWDKLKASMTITKEEALRRIYIQINEINAAIEKRPAGEKYAVGKEADALSKLAAAARNMETEVSISETIEVFKRFLDWLRPANLEVAKEFIMYQDAYIKTMLK